MANLALGQKAREDLMPPSSISWVQLDDKERQRAREFLKDLKAGTVDELGFGRIRQHFSDRFFPATTTIMQAPRYLIFLSGILDITARQSNFQKALIGFQNQLREALEKNEKTGVIGSRAGEDLARFPTDIYWSAMKDLGIYKKRSSIMAILKGVRGYSDETEDKNDEGQAETSSDVNPFLDETALDLGLESLGRGPNSLKLKGNKIAGSLNFTLLGPERKYLQERYTQCRKDSLMAYLLTNPPKNLENIWSLRIPTAEETLVRDLEDAHSFSRIAQGAYLAYEFLLAKRAGHEPRQIAIRKLVEKWLQSRLLRQNILNWDMEKAILSLRTAGAGKVINDGYDDAKFLRHLFSADKSGQDALGWIGDISNLLTSREIRIKGDRAKLGLEKVHIDEEAPLPHDKSEWTDYRAGIGLRYVKEFLAWKG